MHPKLYVLTLDLKTSYGIAPSVFILDGFLSSSIGRAPAIDIKKYDADPPLEVDDEYWEKGFVQPLGKPSVLSFFVHFVRLFEILSKALHELHTSRLSKVRRGWTNEREKQIVAEKLDSLLNDFPDSIPAHLRFNADAQGTFFQQSAVLSATYYWLQVTIHRPYMHNRTSLTRPSLFICLTAARSALSVADACTRSSQGVASNFIQTPAFISAVVLLLNIFASKRAGVSLDVDSELTHVRTAVRIFKACEARWQTAGRSWELLQELQSMDEYLSLRNPPTNEAYPTPVTGTATHIHKDPPSDPLLAGLPANRSDLRGNQPAFRPGTSIGQLLSETATSTSGWSSADLLNDELVSLWLAAPTDLMSVDRWDAYVENMAAADPSCANPP